MPEAAPRSSRCVSLRLTIPCDVAEVRPATQAARSFLAEQGLSEDELSSCELALAEACNNAINYAGEAGKRRPIAVHVECSLTRVDLRVIDHTPGFDWPEKPVLPELDCERGRGLYLMQSLMSEVDYLRGRRENCLLLRKVRTSAAGQHTPAFVGVEDLKRRLGEDEQVIEAMTEELSSCYESLSAIFRYSAEQNSAGGLEDFSRRLLQDLLRITKADWFVLRLAPRHNSHLAVFNASDPAFAGPPLPLPPTSSPTDPAEVHAAITRQDIWFDNQKQIARTDPLRVWQPDSLGLIHPFYFGETLIGTLALGRTVSRMPFTAAQTNVVHTFTDFLGIQIANTRFHEEEVSNLLVARDLEIARNIQRSLLLKDLPQPPGFGLVGFCENAQQVGGDFYDAVRVSDDSVLLIIADVMGKGIPAAMFAAILRSVIRALPDHIRHPGELLTRVNRLLFEELSQVDMFITAQLACVNSTDRSLIVASAGHCPLFCDDATLPDVRLISPEGMPLGILPDSRYAEIETRLGPGSRVLLYTDGITEARNPAGELYGQERLVAWMRHSRAALGDAAALRTDLSSEIGRFQGNTSLKDDLTFLILSG